MTSPDSVNVIVALLKLLPVKSASVISGVLPDVSDSVAFPEKAVTL
ncbi:hypothetical protein [uncultured Nonlabens sp.]|nr:hypothetical protein [uncultured Nonlabens sp.]